MLQNLLLAQPQADDTDPNFENVTLLLSGDGTNGGQNNTFIDGSTNNFTITRNGNTTQGTFSPYGDRWSNYFDGGGDSIVTSSGSTSVGTGNMTMECWVFPLSTGDQIVFDGRSQSNSNKPTIGVINNQLAYQTSGTNRILAGSVPNNTWTHLCIVRNSGVVYAYVNGSQVGTYNDTSDYGTITRFMVGADDDGGSNAFFHGYVSNARFVTSAVYTSSFTPPTAPLTAISGTSLLTCQSNRFIDNSSNNFTITRNGDVSVQRFSPFSPSDAYSASVIGGSAYFDGAGDYLSTGSNAAFNFGTGDYTMECWIYAQSAPQYALILDTRISGNFSTNVAIFTNNSNIVFWAGSGSELVVGTLVLNQWMHLAVSRSSGTLRFFVNGTQTYSGSNTTNLTQGQFIAGVAWSITVPFSGYISDTRIVKGSAVYTANFTPPTAPLTAITNTSVLLNFTNASIIDNAMMADLETVGNAQISTSVKKYGTGSLAFDGTGDYLIAPNSPNMNMGNGNFTVEMWLYVPSLPSTFKRVLTIGNISIPTSDNEGILFEISNANKMGAAVFSGSTNYSVGDPNVLATNTWMHFAFVRNGSTLTLYRDGTSLGTSNIGTASMNFSNTYVTWIGRWPTNTGRDFNGYIDDLRITKGVARYTANFTPPSAPLPIK